MRWGWVTMIVLAISVSGCATMNYLRSEYGSAAHDGEVTGPDGNVYKIWIHKTKPRILVQIHAARAAMMGAVSGATFGGVRETIPRPVFADAAAVWFAQSGRPECHAGGGDPIDRVGYEMDIVCEVPPPARVERPWRR